MTAAASRPEADPLESTTRAAVARQRRVMRLALGTILSFVSAEMLNWELSFVIPVFVAQLLTSPGPPLGLRQGLAIVVVLGLATAAAATVSAFLVEMPVVFSIVLGLVLFLTFVLLRSGRSPAVAMLILVAFSLLPVVAVQAPDAASDIALYLVRSSALAVLWTWLLQSLLPDPGADHRDTPPIEEGTAPPSAVVREALEDTAALLPVIVLSMTLEVPAALVIILTVTAVLRQQSIAGGRKVALVLFLGNLLGGGIAVMAYQLLSAVPTLAFLSALLFLTALFLAYLITNTASLSPLYVTALITFIIVFGMGVAPFLDEPGATLAIRLRNLLLACVYTFVALSLFKRGPRQPIAAGSLSD